MSEMPDILRRICRKKREEIERLRCAGADQLRRAAAERGEPRGFRNALAAHDTVALIAEVKRASPSAGIIREDFDPVAIAQAYARAGAAAVSVLTDAEFFQGSPAFLERVREAVELPVLRKEFILDEIQVIEARALGADAYLLIVAALEPDELAHLMAVGRELGVDPLVEVHDERELDAALEAGADLVGINNRDLRTFEVDLKVTERLAARLPEETAVVAESGIKTRADVVQLKVFGIDAILVGETLMRAEDIQAAAGELTGV
ncbi:MAG: indole-3-glycerol phosphate synthase TrpC [Candidatus Brocadiia bacterium]